MPYVLPVSKKLLIVEFVDEPSKKMPAPSSPNPKISPPFERSTLFTPSAIVRPLAKAIGELPSSTIKPAELTDAAELITTP